MMKSTFNAIQITKDIIHVEDLCDGSCMSVTNDAEAVIDYLHKQFDLTNKKVQYQDTDGQIDKLLHENGKFTGFASGPWIPT